MSEEDTIPDDLFKPFLISSSIDNLAFRGDFKRQERFLFRDITFLLDNLILSNIY